MITPAEIKRKAKRQYKEFLRAKLRREQFFPLQIKGSKGKATTPLKELFPQLRRLLEGAKDKTGFGYTVTLKTVNTRHAGNISMPDEIFFVNVEDYLKFIEKEEEFLKFRKAVQLTQRQVPPLLEWMQDDPAKVIAEMDHWESLLKVVTFFQKNPLPKQYSRALPIDVPATFIEENEKILEELLTAVLPKTAVRNGVNFAERFGFKTVETLIHLRQLETNVFVNFSTKIEQISLPLNLTKSLTISAQQIFIITDEINFLRFPLQENSVAILGNKDTLASLNQLEWLRDLEVYFWGDISISDLKQLSDLRQTLPKVQSFLMDKVILKKYEAWVETDKNVVQDISLLQPAEYELFLELKERKIKLEQKHILQKDLK